MQIPKRRAGKWSEVEPDRHITVEKLERLKSELEQLKKTELMKAANDVRVAADMGDRSENAAYTEAKARWNRVNSRILSIEERLRYAIPIKKGPSDGKVRIGSTVTVEVLPAGRQATGSEKTYEILGSQETDPLRGRISYLSPLGSLLMGKKETDSVTLSANGKDIAYRIVSVK